jgi:hypothetical protein
MAFVTISIYATVIANYQAQGDSQLIELTIDDTDNNGAISTSEWLNYLNAHDGGNGGGMQTGHAAGSTVPPGLYDSGSDGQLSGASCIRRSPIPTAPISEPSSGI